ncbi:MAG: histidine--tRNA ligase [Acidobacteria bacterium]|nr:histidine--tRNA ligase [Acidobacteriota bacterium]
MSKTNPARGMRDFLPADVRKREYVIGIIKEVYESYGFEPLETPAVENLEILMGKYGEEGNQLIFKILKRGEKLTESLESGILGREQEQGDGPNIPDSKLSDLALRYDLTVPLARVVANNKNDLPKFFKRYQIQPVWRADRPARGRFREFYQCDVDCIGSTSLAVESELIHAVAVTLLRLGFDQYSVRLNDRQLLNAMLERCGVNEENRTSLLVLLDKIDKITIEDFLNSIKQLGLGSAASTFAQFVVDLRSRQIELAEIAVASGKKRIDSVWAMKINTTVLDQVAGFVSGTEGGMQAVAELRKLVALTADLGIGSLVMIDPTLARGLSYYTGTIMEVSVGKGIGSIGGGGRYDGLIGMFGKEQIPACGFSLGLERILVVMEERGMFPPEIAESRPADVMVTVWSEETLADSLKLAKELRQNGLRVTLYPEPDKFGKQMKYADQIKVPWVCVLGESEIAAGTVTLKNMTTGEQQTADITETVNKIKGHL